MSGHNHECLLSVGVNLWGPADESTLMDKTLPGGGGLDIWLCGAVLIKPINSNAETINAHQSRLMWKWIDLVIKCGHSVCLHDLP